VYFLGAWLSEDGYEADKEKVKAILELPFPTTKKKLMSWLGMINWFRPLLKNCASELKPISDLLTGKGTVVTSTEDAMKAFRLMKQKLTTMPILVMPDRNKTFFLWCDASFQGLGCALTHQVKDEAGNMVHKPVSYGSRVLTSAEQKWPSFKLEMRAVVWSILKYEHLLYGASQPFVVYTDMKSLTQTGYLNKATCRLLLSWSIKLSEYNFLLEHTPGKDNQLADYLSRTPLKSSNDLWDYWIGVVKDQQQSTSKVLTIIRSSLIEEAEQEDSADNDWDELIQIDVEADGTFEKPLPVTFNNSEELYIEQAKDATLITVRSWLNQKQRPNPTEASNLSAELRTYFNKFDRLALTHQHLVAIKYFGELSQKFRFLVCMPESLKQKTMELKHDRGGHPGVVKTILMVKEKFWWPKMSEEINLHAKACVECFFHNKGFCPKPKMVMKLYEQRNIPNFRCYADTMGPIQKNSGATKHIFLITCGFTKFVSGAVVSNIESPTLAKAFLNSHVLLHGTPDQICTDQGSSIDASELIKHFYDLMNVSKIRTTPYRPSTNLVERINKTAKAILAKLVHRHPDKWDSYLPLALFCYNNTVHSATGFAPNYLFFGRQVKAPNDLFFGTTSTEFYRDQGHYAHDLYWKMRDVYGLVQSSLKKQQEQAKRLYDKSARLTKYKERDHVALVLPLPPSEQPNNKFKSRFRVLYQIEKVISDHNYLVKHLQSNKDRVVHHDLMRLVPPKLASKLKEELNLDHEADGAVGDAVDKPPHKRVDIPRKSKDEEDDDDDDDALDVLLDIDIGQFSMKPSGRKPSTGAGLPAGRRAIRRPTPRQDTSLQLEPAPEPPQENPEAARLQQGRQQRTRRAPAWQTDYVMF
jgi:hypothetical protein